MRKLLLIVFLGLIGLSVLSCGETQQIKYFPAEQDKRLCRGEMTLWLGIDDDDLKQMKFDSEEGYFYYDQRVNGPFSFYFSICGDFISDMRRAHGRFEPEADYYVHDRTDQAGYNALIIPERDEEKRTIDFVYEMDEIDMQNCRGPRECVLWIYDEEVDDYHEYPMNPDDDRKTFTISVDVIGNVVEYYFQICGEYYPDQSVLDEQIEPEPQYYVDDAHDGFNCLYIAD